MNFLSPIVERAYSLQRTVWFINFFLREVEEVSQVVDLKGSEVYSLNIWLRSEFLAVFFENTMKQCRFWIEQDGYLKSRCKGNSGFKVIGIRIGSWKVGCEAVQVFRDRNSNWISNSNWSEIKQGFEFEFEFKISLQNNLNSNSSKIF